MSYLIETWDILERHSVEIQRERGCVATAITAAAWGHAELAERLLCWAHQHAPDGLMAYFGPLLERSLLADVIAVQEGALDLGALLDEVREIAALE